MRKKIFAFLIVIWMCVIFSFSSQEADESTNLSLGVGAFIGHIFIPSFDEWPEEARAAFAERIDHPVRKCAHASEYALLGFLLMGAMYPGAEGSDSESEVHARGFVSPDRKLMTFRCHRFLPVRAFFLSLITGFLYACSDEFHQLFVPGRAALMGDVLIDTLGLAFGIAVMIICFGLYLRFLMKFKYFAKSHEDSSCFHQSEHPRPK